MRSNGWTGILGPRALLCSALVVLAIVLPSCSGGGGGDGGTTSPPTIQCSSSAPGLNEVALACGGQSGQTTEVVKVVLGGGPTAAPDVQGFHFDLVYDSAKIAFVQGSAVAGTFLSKDGDSPLLAAQLANGLQGRVIVGYDRTLGSGVQGTDPTNYVLQLSFTTVGTDAFGPEPLLFQNAEVVDHTGNNIGAITFKNGLSLSYQ